MSSVAAVKDGVVLDVGLGEERTVLSQRVYGDRQVTSPWGRGSGGGSVSHIWISAALANMLTVIPGVTVFHRLSD